MTSVEKRWLLLEPHVHVARQGGRALLYNPLNGVDLECTDPEVLELLERLRSPENLLVVRLLDDLEGFVADLRRCFMGDVIEARGEGRPIQLMPRLTIQRDVKHLIDDPERAVGEDVMGYLSEVFVELGGGCRRECRICEHAHRQLACCARSEAQLAPEQVEALLSELPSGVLVHLLGGHPFEYPGLARVIERVGAGRKRLALHAHYDEAADAAGLKLLPEGSLLTLLAPAPVNPVSLAAALENARALPLLVAVDFVVCDGDEAEAAQVAAESLGLTAFRVRPCFDGTNQGFFREQVFVDRETIVAARPDTRALLANSCVNRLDFGKLTITSAGRIYANINGPCLGELGKDSVRDALCRELLHGDSWRRIRADVEPCRRCLFERLCPPLSSYEHALGRNNLCQIFEDGWDR